MMPFLVLALTAYGSVCADDPPLANPPALAGKVDEEIVRLRSFWSFRPFARAHDSDNVNSAGGERSIDAAIRIKLGASGLRASPPADRRVLIRRAGIDLTGLPPSPADVEAFDHDD